MKLSHGKLRRGHDSWLSKLLVVSGKQRPWEGLHGQTGEQAWGAGTEPGECEGEAGGREWPPSLGVLPKGTGLGLQSQGQGFHQRTRYHQLLL